jgi:hypothetical protein
MFTRLNKQGVRSERGFEVQRTDRFSSEYREGDKVVSLYVESGVNGGLPCIIVDATAFTRWDGDGPGQMISPEQQARMFQNLKEALEFQGLGLIVQSNFDPG